MFYGCVHYLENDLRRFPLSTNLRGGGGLGGAGHVPITIQHQSALFKSYSRNVHHSRRMHALSPLIPEDSLKAVGVPHGNIFSSPISQPSYHHKINNIKVLMQTELLSAVEEENIHVTIARERRMEDGTSTVSLLSDNFQSCEMDPVSATASIAGLVAIATTLVKSAYTLSEEAREFRTEWTSIADECAQLLGILTALRPMVGYYPFTDQIPVYSFSDSTPSSPTSSSHSPRSTPSETEYDIISLRQTGEYLTTHLKNELTASESTLREIENRLSQTQWKPGQIIANVKKQLLWPFRKPEFHRLLEKLGRHKSNFVLILSSQGTYKPFLPALILKENITRRPCRFSSTT